MDKGQALQAFLASFGVRAYDENTVPADAPYPRLTYAASTASFGEPVSISASLWYRSTSWADVVAKADEIGASVGMGGAFAPYDGGTIWIQRGVPFAQRMGDPDPALRRILISFTAEYLSQD